MKILSNEQYQSLIDRIEKLESGYSDLKRDSVYRVYEENSAYSSFWNIKKKDVRLVDLIKSIMTQMNLTISYVPEQQAGYELKPLFAAKVKK